MRFRKHQDAAKAASRGLLLLFAGVLALLVLAVNGVLALIYRISLPWVQGYPHLFFETNTALVLLFVLGGCWFETLRLREGGPHVAKLAGGRPLDPPHGHAHDLYEKRVRNIVDEVAIAANLKPPPVYVLEREQAINAFAAGWGAEDAVIVVTRGALERLTRDELQGVVAHEFSHILHGDVRLNMRLIGLVWGLQMIYNFGHSLAEPDEDGRRGAATLFGLGLMGVGSLGWIAGRMLKAAVSRQREFLADASAVQFTRSADGLGGALRKIADQASQGRDVIHHAQAESLSHLFFVSALRWSVFATHPPLGERIRRIYGFDVLPLAAKVLAEEDDDAPDTQPMLVGSLAMVGDEAGGGAAGAASWDDEPFGLISPATVAMPVLEQAVPEAAGNDVTWQAAQENPVQREREALARVHHWQGPGERRAAILGLLLTPGEPHELEAWHVETATLPAAEAVYAELQKLTHASRAPVWELMLRRSARAPLAERRTLVEAARRVMKADGHVSPLDRLRWLGMRHLLSGAAQVKPPSGPDNDIAHLSKHVAVVTSFLARIIDDESRSSVSAHPVTGDSAWAQAVWRSALPGVPLPEWPSPDGDELVQGWAGLVRLSAMQRPVLLRCWVEAAVELSPQRRLNEVQADALRLAALLLDCPSPRVLADQYIEVE